MYIHTRHQTCRGRISYSDADSSAASTWNGPVPEVVTILCLLCAAFATSPFAISVLMFGKWRVNRYPRGRGGSHGGGELGPLLGAK